MAQCRHIDACRIRHETPSLVLSVRTLMSFPSQHNAHCVSLPKERKAVAEVPQRKHWRLPGTPRMLLFIEMTGRRNRGCSDRGTVFGQAPGFEDENDQLRIPECVSIVNRNEHTAEVAMTQAVTRDNRGTVFGRTLGLESDGMEEPMMPGCVSIANCHEHTAGEGPHCISIRAVERQTGCRKNCRQSVQQYQVDDRWSSCPHRRWPVSAVRCSALS